MRLKPMFLGVTRMFDSFIHRIASLRCSYTSVIVRCMQPARLIYFTAPPQPLVPLFCRPLLLRPTRALSSPLQQLLLRALSTALWYGSKKYAIRIPPALIEWCLCYTTSHIRARFAAHTSAHSQPTTTHTFHAPAKLAPSNSPSTCQANTLELSKPTTFEPRTF